MLHANWLNEGDVIVVGKLKVGLIGAIAMSMTLLSGAEISHARGIRAKILQEKLGRLYFSAGKDEDVWPGCRWRVYRDSTDTIKSVCEGKIAESYEGVSISDSVVKLATQLTSSSVARIEAADTARCRIWFMITSDTSVQWFSNMSRPDGKELCRHVRGGDESGWIPAPVDPTYVLGDTFLNSVNGNCNYFDQTTPLSEIPDWYWLDCELSYARSCREGLIQIDEGVAPHFVALIPNVSQPVNRNAVLTTALRYRIDTSQINNAFEFESVPQLSFLPGTHSYSAYATDITKAKKLLKENKTAGASVSIDTYSPTLKSTSRYIQGTLTQAGYATSTVGWNEPADLRLAILPIYSDSPWVALREVLTSIAKDTIAKDKANQPVRLADQLLKDALATTDSTRRIQLLERVDRMLMEDIGAFPLFRPIIYVCAKEEIRGIKFDKDGRLDLRSIYRLKLPGDTAEAQR